MPNIIITGIPRSGTTLVTALIDSMPDTVALNEPRWQYEWADRNKTVSTATDFAEWLASDFTAVRQKLLDRVPIPERRMTDGSPVTNYYRPDPLQQKVEQTFSLMPFTRAGLTPDFTLAVKHNGLYLGALRQIIETGAFRVIAIIRHPVGVIASWNNVPIPLGEGKMPGAMPYWKQMSALTHSGIPLLEKQVRMYDLVCQRLYQLRDRIHLIKYEDMVENPNMLTAITGKASSLPSAAIKKRDVSFYNTETQTTREMLKRVGKYHQLFYKTA